MAFILLSLVKGVQDFLIRLLIEELIYCSFSLNQLQTQVKNELLL